MGGPFITIKSISTNTYTDSSLNNNTTYFYVITSIISGVESTNSNVVTATPIDTIIAGNRAVLELTMTNGIIKEYNLTSDEVANFITWYDNRSNGTDKSYYVITKTSNIKPFINRREYFMFDKIFSFEVKDYNE
jgi:hypothetical protein